MLDTQRIILSKDGVLSDLSLPLCDYLADSSVLNLEADTDYLYIGSLVPFNHLYIDVKVANTTNSSLSIQVYNNNTWEDCVDVIDGTKTGAKTLAKSGIVQFALSSQKGWSYESYSYDIPELSVTNIFDFYWCRISVSVDLFATTEINYIGHRFCTDTDINSMYPMLNNSNLMTAYKTGKTNWLEQILTASEFIIRDLQGRGLIKAAGQIFDYGRFKNPCIYKTVEIIFGALGQGYTDERNDARKAYQDDMHNARFNFDRKMDGRLDQEDRLINSRFFTR